jgi:dihydroxy-acid dehydratase
MALRSNFEPGTSRWATRRAQWRALGLTDEDMVKPKIAIVNSSSQLAICFSHLDEIARRARRAVEQAGGVAFEVRTAAPSDFITSAGHRGGYILSARDLITNDIEVAVEGALLDGMLCLASCDKTGPGQLMAAARLNIPSVVVACGYQPSGTYQVWARPTPCTWPARRSAWRCPVPPRSGPTASRCGGRSSRPRAAWSR